MGGLPSSTAEHAPNFGVPSLSSLTLFAGFPPPLFLLWPTRVHHRCVKLCSSLVPCTARQKSLISTCLVCCCQQAAGRGRLLTWQAKATASGPPNGSPAGRPHFKQIAAKGEVRTSPPSPASFRANVPLPPQHRTECPGFPHQNAQIQEANRNSGTAAKADTSARC